MQSQQSMPLRRQRLNLRRFRISIFGAVALCLTGNAYALNYFELEVYPYATAQRGAVEVENFTTYTSRGRDDSPAPDNNKGLIRSTFELSYGLTDKTEVAYYRDYQRARGEHFEHAGGRFRVRTRFAEKGEWPVDLGLYGELEFPRGEDDDVEGEVRGIIEKDFGRWTLDVNPIVERVLSGPGHAEGWELGYAMALVYRADERWQPRLDLFGDFGPIRHFEPRNEQKHLLMPGIDARVGRHFHAGFGIGFGLTEATEQRLVRARLEWEF